MSSDITYDLSGAVSVVTGGGRDVGKAIARALSADWAAHKLCVHAAGPGLTRAELNRLTWGETEHAGEYLGAVPKDRVSEPEVKVGAVLFCPPVRCTSSSARTSMCTAAIWPHDLYPE